MESPLVRGKIPTWRQHRTVLSVWNELDGRIPDRRDRKLTINLTVSVNRSIDEPTDHQPHPVPSVHRSSEARA